VKTRAVLLCLAVGAAVFFGCTSRTPVIADVARAADAATVEDARFAVIPASAYPGYPVTVAFSYDSKRLATGQANAAAVADALHKKNLRAVLVSAEGRRLTQAAFFALTLPEENGQAVKAAVMAIPSLSPIGEAAINIESDAGIIQSFPFTIYNRTFDAETIQLDQANTDLRTTSDPKRTAESQHIWAVFNRTGTDVYSWDRFVRPVTSTRRTSPFGSRRIFQYATGARDTTVHNGLDFGVPVGTDVMACARGRVVVARSRIITGMSVVIEHLPGLYSVYYHLDTIDVREGDLVEVGKIVGKSGVTGLVTGPHLHWEIRVSGESADPDAFLSRPVLDKNEILSHLRSGS